MVGNSNKCSDALVCIVIDSWNSKVIGGDQGVDCCILVPFLRVKLTVGCNLRENKCVVKVSNNTFVLSELTTYCNFHLQTRTSQDSFHLYDQIPSRYVTPSFKPFRV